MRKTLKKYFLWAITLLFAAVIACESRYIVVLRQQRSQLVTQQNELIQWYRSHCIEYEDGFSTSSLAQGYLLRGELKKALAWSNLIIDTAPDGSYTEDIEGYKGDTSWPMYMHNIRGDVYYAMSDYAKAIDDYSIVINLNAKDIKRNPELFYPKYNVYVKRANAFRSLGETQCAIKDFCDGIIFAKSHQDWSRNKTNKAVLPPLPDDLLGYLEEHRDMFEDENKFEKCVQILKQWE